MTTMAIRHSCPAWADRCNQFVTTTGHVHDWTVGASTVRVGTYMSDEWDDEANEEVVTVERWIGVHGDVHELGQLESSADARALAQALLEAADLLETASPRRARCDGHRHRP